MTSGSHDVRWWSQVVDARLCRHGPAHSSTQGNDPLHIPANLSYSSFSLCTVYKPWRNRTTWITAHDSVQPIRIRYDISAVCLWTTTRKLLDCEGCRRLWYDEKLGLVPKRMRSAMTHVSILYSVGHNISYTCCVYFFQQYLSISSVTVA